MRIAVGITLYQPEREDILYINQLSKLVEKIYLYDNSADNKNYVDLLDPALVYQYSGSNDGLSVAFNWCLDNALASGQDQLLLLDQDSHYDLTIVENFLTQIKQAQPDENVAIRACNVKESDGRITSREQAYITEVNCVITSGSVLDLQVVRRHGLRYDEELFVDHVDHAFCRLVRENGLKILCYNHCVVEQQLGYLYRGRVCHSAVRHYYMVRDLGYMNRKRHGKIATFYKSFRYFLREVLVCLREDKSWKKIRYGFRGYCDYLMGRHGEYKRYHK